VAIAVKTEAAAEGKPKKKRPRWMLVAVGVLLLVCCVFGLLTFRSMRLQDGNPPPTEAAVATFTSAPPTDQNPSPPPPTKLLPLPQATLSPAVLDALQLVEQSPNDPQANLQLSLAYWDAGQRRLAFETLTTAANLAGRDQGFFIAAAEQFAIRDAWVAAAGMYIRAVGAQPDGNISPELDNAFRESVYKASAELEFKVYLAFDKVAQINEPLSLIAQSRYTLYNNSDIAGARELLNRARGLKPNMPEAMLLEAELLLKEGNTADAKLTLITLNANLDTPQWIREMADKFLTQIP